VGKLPHASRASSNRNETKKQKWNAEVRFEVFTAVSMKNAVFWDIKTQFVHHRRHIISPLQSPTG
jgi:hypothetical protein